MVPQSPSPFPLPLPAPPLPAPPRLEAECQRCQVRVNAVRFDLITPAYLKVSSGLLARHKIDVHQGQALKATVGCRASARTRAKHG